MVYILQAQVPFHAHFFLSIFHDIGKRRINNYF
jgi:hypothetical protein